MQNEQTATPSGQIIDTLWSDEGCSWSVRLDDGKWWTVVLEWTDDHSFVHGADWVTFTWEFCDRSLNDALTYAAAWCQCLAPWRRCPACDGKGEWNGNRCDECDATGLDNAGGDPR